MVGNEKIVLLNPILEEHARKKKGDAFPMDQCSKNIKAAILKSKRSYVELEKITGISKSALQRYATGDTKKIPVDCIEKIAKATDTSVQELLGWETPTSDPVSIYQQFPNIRPVCIKTYPVLEAVDSGRLIFADQLQGHAELEDSTWSADFCFLAQDDSMMGAGIAKGCMVFMQNQTTVEHGQIGLAVRKGELMLRRFYFYPEQNLLQLTAEHAAYPPLIFQNEELQQVQILGKAVYFMRAL